MSTLLELVRSVPARAALIPHSRPTIEPEDIEAVSKVIETGMIAEGRLSATFEERLAGYLGTPSAVATGTGTQALHLALLALGFGHGDRVAMPTLVCRSVLDAVLAAGARPVLIDSGPQYNMNPVRLAEVVTKCRAVIVPHIMGITSEIEAIRALGIPVIEDCAQSLGGMLNGKKLGTFGDVAIFSFQAIKVMTTGEGGAVTSNRPDVMERVRRLKYERLQDTGGRFLYPLSDIQAAMGLSQLKRLDTFIEVRRNLAERYFAELAGIGAELPEGLKERSMFYRFPIRVESSAEKLIDRFAERGVAVRLPVNELLHRRLGYPPDDFPVAEQHLRLTLGLPIYPSLSDNEQQHVIEVTRDILG